MFSIARFSIHTLFPQISSICVHACELALRNVLQQGSGWDITSPLETIQHQYYTHNQHMTRSMSRYPRIPNRRESRSGKQQPNPPDPVITHRTRSSQLREKQKGKQDLQTKKKRQSYELFARDFVKEIDNVFFTPHQQKFWMFYQNVDCEASFKDVVPVSQKRFKPNEYLYRSNVIWEYSRVGKPLPMSNQYRVVKFDRRTVYDS